MRDIDTTGHEAGCPAPVGGDCDCRPCTIVNGCMCRQGYAPLHPEGADIEIAQVWCDRCDKPATRAIPLTNGTIAYRCDQDAWLLIAPRGRHA